MEGSPRSPLPVKAEEQSQSVLFTYFHGDISSMVDEHFDRALGKAKKSKSPGGKGKRNRKVVKTEQDASSQWNIPAPSWSEAPFPPLPGRIQLGTPKEALPCAANESPALWSYATRQGALGLGPMVYPQAMSSAGLGAAEQQYTPHSLLNLLHSDRLEVGGGAMPSASKPELLPGWSHPGFRDPMNPSVSVDSGILEKKDLYWY